MCWKNVLAALVIFQLFLTTLSCEAKESDDLLREEAIRYYENEEYGKALKLLISTELSKSPDIQFQVSQMYEHGIGVEKNDEEALSWLVMSISQGHYQAISYMVNVYKFGLLGFQKDKEKESYWQQLSLDIADKKVPER